MAPLKPCAAKSDCVTPLKPAVAEIGSCCADYQAWKGLSAMARFDITLNMMLDRATRIVDTSKWIVVDASSELWIVDPRIEPTEQNNWGAVFNGISTRQEAEAIIRKELCRSRPKPINPPAEI
jgi:hypothetical protein